MKVTKDRIYEQDLFEPLKKMARESAVDLGKMDAQTKLLSKSLVDLSKKFDGTAKSQRALVDADNASKKAMQDKIAIQQKQERLEKILEKQRLSELRLQKEREKAFDRYEKQLKDQEKLKEKQLRQQEKEQKALKESSREYVVQSKRLNDLRKEYKDLILTQGKETAETIRLKKEIISLDATLKKVDATVGQHQRSVGNYQKALGGVRNALTQLGVGFGVFQILRDTFGIISENDDAMASLSAITGLTGEKFDVFKTAINDVATELNVSSTEVAQAAEKIASAQPALLDNADALAAVTKEAITLNRAIKGDLTETSLALVGVMNQFGLEATEAAEVINILAAGSQAGAASVNQINESIVKFGTTADLMNITVEESVGLIETLGEKAIFGADAGTALRNILLKMSSIDVLPEKALKQLEKYGVNTDIVKDKSLSFEERLRELSKVAKDSTAIMQIFGTENATAATVLLNNLDTYGKMTAAVTDTNIATEQAAINQNTLSAVIEELRATWENLVIEFKDGTDVADGLKNVIRFVTENLREIITVVFAGIKAWVLYKSTLTLVNNSGTGMIQMFSNLKKGIEGTKFSLGTFAKGLAGIAGIAAVIVPLLWDMVTATYEMYSNTSALEKVTEKYNKQIDEERAKMDLLRVEVQAAIGDKEKMSVLITKINDTYGTTLQNIDDETQMMNQLWEAYRKVNAEMERRIMSQILEEELLNAFKAKREFERLQSELGDRTFINSSQWDLFQLGIEKSTTAIKDLQAEMARIGISPSQGEDLGNLSKLGLSGPEGAQTEANKTVDVEKKKLDQLAELRKTHADLLIQFENEAIKAGYDRQTVDELLVMYKKELLENELEFIQELQLKTREEYNKTYNERIKLIDAETKKLESAKIERIENNQELKESEESLWETIARLGAEAAKKQVDAQKEALEAIYETFKEITDLVAELIDKNASKIDQQIARQQMIHDGAKDREAELRRIAEERKLNADESIEAEREAQKKALVEIERLESKKRQLEMIVAAMKLLSDGKSVADIKSSITDITSFVKANAEGSFYEGTDTTVGAALGHNNVKDGHVVNVDDKEAIFNPGQTAALGIRPGGNTTQDVVDAFKHVQGIADAKLSSGISGGSFADNIYSSAILNQLVEMKHELKSLPDNMPKTDLGFNAHVGSLEFERRTRLRTEKVRYNIRRK